MCEECHKVNHEKQKRLLLAIFNSLEVQEAEPESGDAMGGLMDTLIGFVNGRESFPTDEFGQKYSEGYMLGQIQVNPFSACLITKANRFPHGSDTP
jgi:hypothetical protein